MILTLSLLIDTILLLLIFIGFLVIYSTRNFNYWKKRGVHGPKPLPLVGNILNVLLLKFSLGLQFVHWARWSDDPYLGIFMFDEPCLLIRSPEIIKNILGKDFNYFKDRTVASPNHDDIIAKTLFIQKSPGWRNTRSKMTPVFSSGKLKNMFPVIKGIGNNMIKFIKANPERVDVKNLCYNYSIGMIAKCFFGIEDLSFEDDMAEFGKVGKALFKFTLRNAFTQSVYFFKTGLVNLLKLRFFDSEQQSFFVNIYRNTIKQREEMKIEANDFLGTMMDIRKQDPTFGEYEKYLFIISSSFPL